MNKNTQTYYMPMSRGKLAHFYKYGIIFPSKYFDANTVNSDIQNKFDDYLLFSTVKFPNEADCCIEVVLDSEEQTNKVSEDFSLFDMPLAVSRVVTIYFKNEVDLKETRYNINSGTAFLPDYLLQISNEPETSLTELDYLTYKSNGKDWTHELKRYDQLMGGFSLMKLSSDKEQNYPEHYFVTLGNVNSYFDKKLKQQSVEVENNFRSMFLDDNKKLKTSKFREEIYSEISIKNVKEFSQLEEVNIQEKYGSIDLHSLDSKSLTYLLAIIAQYGEGIGRTRTIEDFFIDFLTGSLNPTRKESIALSFGLNRGYSAFRNNYSLGKVGKIDVKFQLNSQLDFYTIESIYQNVFNLNSEYSSFEVIDSYHDFTREYSNDFDNESYDIASEHIIIKKKEKIGFFDLLQRSFQSNSNKDEVDTEINNKLSQLVSRITNPIKQQFDCLGSNIQSIKSAIRAFKKDLVELRKTQRIIKQEIDELKLNNQSNKESDDLLNRIKILEQSAISKQSVENTIIENSNKISELDSGYLEQIKVLQNKIVELESEKVKVEHKFVEQICQLELTHTQEVEQLKIEVESTQVKNIEQTELLSQFEENYILKQDSDTKISDLTVAHNKELSELQSESKKHKGLTIDLQDSKNVMQKDYQEQIHQLELTHKQEVEHLKTEGKSMHTQSNDMFPEELSNAIKPTEESSRAKELNTMTRGKLDEVAEKIDISPKEYSNMKVLKIAILEKEFPIDDIKSTQ